MYSVSLTGSDFAEWLRDEDNRGKFAKVVRHISSDRAPRGRVANSALKVLDMLQDAREESDASFSREFAYDALAEIQDFFRAEREFNSKKLQLSNGNFLNLECVPTAVRFWLHLRNLRPYAWKSDRCVMESDYVGFASEAHVHKFSHVLFAMSWMKFLTVYKNGYIIFNSQPVLKF